MIFTQKAPLGTPLLLRWGELHPKGLFSRLNSSSRSLAIVRRSPACKVVAFTEVGKDLPSLNLSFTRPATEDDYCKASIKVRLNDK